MQMFIRVYIISRLDAGAAYGICIREGISIHRGDPDLKAIMCSGETRAAEVITDDGVYIIISVNQCRSSNHR